jgi:hypothetical protein
LGHVPAVPYDNAELDDWDIFGVGYSSNLRFEIGHLWAGDASLELLGYYLRTILSLPPLQEYHRRRWLIDWLRNQTYSVPRSRLRVGLK